MAKKFKTSCTKDDGILNGTIELDPASGEVLKYYSIKAAVEASPINEGNGASKLSFKVTFDGHRYHITASPHGSGWKGNAGPTLGVEPWTATATEPIKTKSS